MKLPSAVDIGVVIAVLAGLQALFSTLPEAQVWWAPAVAAGLLAALKVLQVNWPKPAPPPGAAALASEQFAQQQNETKLHKWLID